MALIRYKWVGGSWQQYSDRSLIPPSYTDGMVTVSLSVIDGGNFDTGNPGVGDNIDGGTW